jgi:ribonucleoside-diphosphate reductase alpha chain
MSIRSATHPSNASHRYNPSEVATEAALGSRNAAGMEVPRRFTRPGQDPLAEVLVESRSSTIAQPGGAVVFAMDDVEVPAAWSQLATDILASKYLRKAGVPQSPSPGARSTAESGPPEGGRPKSLGPEKSALQVVRRIARSIRQSGERQGGYFRSPSDAEAFEAELSYLLIHQHGAFNSPVWFNCGLSEAYGLRGPSVGSYAHDQVRDEALEVDDTYERPQVSACFIQSVNDDLMDIAAGIQREMRLFKFGSGTGSNFSRLRAKGEPLSSGGTSSGVMSFLEVYDRAAGAIKSGGTTRRAAKMVCLDMDHPDVEEFIEWKVREEEKVRALVRAGFSADFNGEAYHTVSGQNANNSVRANDAFMEAVTNDGSWETRYRTTGGVAKTYKARELMRKISEATWRCADPGMQFSSTCNRWNTVKNTDQINATNPCAEFIFLDDTACNLASLNLLAFRRADGDSAESRNGGSLAGSFDHEAFAHACRVFFLAQEILVDHASYPSHKIASRSHDFRPLGLGFANLGSLLIVNGLAYDSDEARTLAGTLGSLMTGTAFEVSAEIAASKGPFRGFAHNREPMLEVMNQHRDATYGLESCGALTEAARQSWDRALALGIRYGYRNAQATVLAPTGTIGLLMDCDTTGVEPDFALVKFKKLGGGGSFKIVNGSVPRGLRNLGYSTSEIDDIVEYLRGAWSLSSSPGVNRSSLRAKGLSDAEVDAAERALPSAHVLSHAFSAQIIGEDAYRRLGFEGRLEDPTFDLLAALEFTPAQIEAAGLRTGGRLTIEGAPHLRDEHLPIFDCASRCGPQGKRAIAPSGHLHMMAAVQPFLSGGISKTVNLPSEVTVEEVEAIYVEAWRLGLKGVALYRDGSKACQVLNTSAEDTSTDKDALNAASTSGPAPSDLPPRLVRKRLPKRRRGFTQEARVGGQKVYLRTGEYEDGTLGEVFIDMHKEGAAMRSIMNCFAISLSLGLQHGVPLEEFVNAFTFTRFEPQGQVQDHPNVKFATSVVDYLFRALALDYLGRTDLVHVVPEDASPESATRGGEQVRQALAEGGNSQDLSASEPVSDAPFCGDCGSLTVRNGTCYRCHNCGSSMGCS